MQAPDWKHELACAQIEISALDRAYARLRLAQINVAANHAISTLPEAQQQPFLAIMRIAQSAGRMFKDD